MADSEQKCRARLTGALLGCLIFLTPAITHPNDSGLNEGVEGPMPIDLKHGEESKLRMLSEELRFQFSPEKTKVTAKFRFINTDRQSTITQLVGFPDIGKAYRAGLDGTSMHNVSGPIEGMKTKVNGVTTKSIVRSGKIRREPGSQLWLPPDDTTDTQIIMAWHTLHVVVAPGEEIKIEREYTTRNGSYPYWYDVFMYVTHTGAAWAGTIGKLTADVELSGGLTVDDLTWSTSAFDDNPYEIAVHPAREQWRKISRRHMRLVWNDFEPATDISRRHIFLVAQERDWFPMALFTLAASLAASVLYGGYRFLRKYRSPA